MGKELFKNIPSKVGDLVKDVRNGRIGLPDLQRPFVWRDNKVRELFDSMLKGYPIGYIMLWESPVDYESKKSTIGDNSKTYEEPKELVIDGQQRLTALVAAMFAVKVKDKNFADREIKISYNPLTREFAVWSQAYEKDTEWISRISDVFLAKEDNSISSLRRRFIKEANEGRSKKELPLLTDEEEDISTTPPTSRFQIRRLKTMSLITAKSWAKMVTAKHVRNMLCQKTSKVWNTWSF